MALQDENDPCFVHECITIVLREAQDYRAKLTTNLCLVGLDNVNREYLVTRENLNRIAEGILTDYFDDIKGLQDENNPRFIDEIITIFLRVAEDYRADHSQEICN
ncbi:unnamed protein product [Prunus armeniaca]|uniref:Uncharacterized protein n=1 Tax=Prunus armeniaca TaxID=36596 RepID=A0A6J5XM04_PRUAR|nr:unnamed protein product [Prunus armeniaca]